MKHKPMFGKTLGQMQAQNFPQRAAMFNAQLAATNKPSNRHPQDIHVFDNGGGYYHTTQMPGVIAEGAAVKIDGNWYLKFRGNLSPINFCDIPDEAKTTMLLLGLSL